MNHTWRNIAILFFILLLLSSLFGLMAIGSGHTIPKDTRREFFIIESALIAALLLSLYFAWKVRKK